MDNRKSKQELKETIDAIEEPVEEIKIEDEVPETPETPEVPETPETPEPPKEEKKELTDYEREYKKASQEAMTQYFKNKKISETFEEAENIPEPTEVELKTYAMGMGQDYDLLDDFSKGILKRQMLSEKRFDKISLMAGTWIYVKIFYLMGS